MDWPRLRNSPSGYGPRRTISCPSVGPLSPLRSLENPACAPEYERDAYMLLLSPSRPPPQAYCSFSAQRTAAGGRAPAYAGHRAGHPRGGRGRALSGSASRALRAACRPTSSPRRPDRSSVRERLAVPGRAPRWVGHGLPNPRGGPALPHRLPRGSGGRERGGFAPPARDAPRPPGGDGLLQLPRRLLPGGRGSPLVGLRPRARASRAECPCGGPSSGAASSRARVRARGPGRCSRPCRVGP